MKTPTVLVIDDDKTICDSCCRVYEQDAYRVDIARDGTTGMQKIKQLKPDIALVDLKMPGMSGMEVLDEIRKCDPTIVSIVITGYGTIESAVEAMKKGAYDFLPKPFTPDELRLITKRGLERRRLGLEAAALRLEKEKMKTLFISMVSHQLRSPLTAAQAYFDLILGDFVRDPAEQKRIISQASSRIKGLLALTSDWLKMAGIDNDRLRKEFEYLDLAPILSECVDLMKPRAEEKAVSLHLEAPNALPVVRGDSETLQEVFVNLIDNAIKYNRHGGTVTIGARENGDHLLIEVSDTGIGISKADIDFIFDEFFRVKNKETRQITGTGLGLSIVKRMIEAHSGSVGVSSVVGEGTTFTVTLPKPDETKQQP